MKPDVFKAIADPTRRQIVELLFDRKGVSINTIVEKFQISRQATTKHLYYLRNAGLISIETEGRERLCYPNYAVLKEVSNWLHIVKPLWEDKPTELELYTDQFDNFTQ